MCSLPNDVLFSISETVIKQQHNLPISAFRETQLNCLEQETQNYLESAKQPLQTKNVFSSFSF
jgi:hypothetical protein